MTLEAITSDRTVRPVYVGWLDIKDDPIYGWTGPGAFAPSGTGDAVLDSNVFLQLDSAVELSGFSVSADGTKPVRLTFSAHDETAAAMRQIVRDRRVWRMRRAKIWRFFMMPDNASVFPEFQQMASGFISRMTYSRSPGSPATIAVEIDSDLALTSGAPLRWIDERGPWSSFIADLQRGPITVPRAAPPSRSGGGGGRSDSRLLREL